MNGSGLACMEGGFPRCLDTGNRQYLDDSVLYNEDDCRATKLIKEWMASGGVQGDLAAGTGWLQENFDAGTPR